MKARVRETTYSNAPPRLRHWGSPQAVLGLELGSEHEVRAVAVYSGVALFTILHGPLPWSFPAWLFDVIDDTIPADWIVRSFGADSELDLLMGPSFIAGSARSFFSIADADPEIVDEFLKRYDPRISKIHQELDEEMERKKRFGLA